MPTGVKKGPTTKDSCKMRARETARHSSKTLRTACSRGGGGIRGGRPIKRKPGKTLPKGQKNQAHFPRKALKGPQLGKNKRQFPLEIKKTE